ncbi:hypothetical protein ACJZ2D_016202 [Fusarium nematophilum]
MAPALTEESTLGVPTKLDSRTEVFSKKGSDADALAVGARTQDGRNVMPRIPKFTSKEEEQKYCKEHLACAFRLFAEQGYDEGIAGHMSLRDSIRPDHFWINP